MARAISAARSCRKALCRSHSSVPAHSVEAIAAKAVKNVPLRPTPPLQCTSVQRPSPDGDAACSWLGLGLGLGLGLRSRLRSR